MNGMLRALPALALMLIGWTSAEASERFSPANVQKLDKIIADQMKAENLPSVVVGVWVPGEGRYVRSMGVADRRTGRKRQPQELFRIASISKTFIATTILQLVDEGRIGKLDKIAKWYPDFPKADEITVDDLLRMRSGMPDSADQAFLAEYYDHRLITLTPKDMIERGAERVNEFKKPNQPELHHAGRHPGEGDRPAHRPAAAQSHL